MKHLESALGGFFFATLLFVFWVVPQVRFNWRAQGHNEGVLDANVKMQKTAEKFFLQTPAACTHLESLGGAKPSQVNVVDCGSFKTLRIVK